MLTLEVEVSIHEGLVGIVDSLKICVLASLINFKAVELSLEGLKLSCEFVSSVVLLTVGL
jgi:hypothetical protein